jgi:hypothetical protein
MWSLVSCSRQLYFVIVIHLSSGPFPCMELQCTDFSFWSTVRNLGGKTREGETSSPIFFWGVIKKKLAQSR